MIPLDPDRSGFSQAAFAGWFWCVAPWGPSIGRSEHVSGADGPAEECWICWIGHKAQISEWRRLSQSHWQIDMFHMCIRTHTYNTCIYCPYDYHIWYDFYLYAYLRDLLGTNAWSFWQQYPSLMCFWKFRGDATKQLEHKPQSQRPAMPQTAQNLPDVTNASGRKSDEHMSKPLMRSPKSRCYSARVCYSLWGSDGMHFYNYAGPQTKKSHAFAFLFWCIACCSFSILYSMSISFEGQLKLNHRNVMKCYSHACHNWLILVVGLPCFPYFPVVADHLQVLVPQASGEYVTECHRIHAVDEEFGKHQEAQRKIFFFLEIIHAFRSFQIIDPGRKHFLSALHFVNARLCGCSKRNNLSNESRTQSTGPPVIRRSEWWCHGVVSTCFKLFARTQTCKKNQNDQNMCPAIPAVRSPLLVDACCEAFNFVHATSSTRIRAATSKEILAIWGWEAVEGNAHINNWEVPCGRGDAEIISEISLKPTSFRS